MEFIDAKEIIVFNQDGTFNEAHTEKELENVPKAASHAVIRSFYGFNEKNEIVTFSREAQILPVQLLLMA